MFAILHALGMFVADMFKSRAGTAVVREISCQNTDMPSSPKPWPPRLSGTSNSQKPASLALRWMASRSALLMAHRSNGISSRSTKRRKLRRNSSSSGADIGVASG
jgi:hypothetical protein